jgi:ATP-dependent helicase/nuclease subunit B
MRLTAKPVTPAFPFHTIESVAHLLYAATRDPRRAVSGPVQSLLFEGAIRNLKDSLEYFALTGGTARLFAGTLEKVIEVIVNLKESGITPTMLEKEAESAPLDEQRKLHDIAAIFGRYEKALEDIHGTDLPGVLEFLARECPPEEFQRVFRQLFPRTDLCSLAGFDQFTEPELGLLQRLIGVPGLAVTLLFDYEPGNPALFGHLESNYRRFKDLGFAPARDLAPRHRLFPVNTISRSPSSRGAADLIARTLFLANRPAHKVDLRRSVTMMTAASRRQEVSLICKLIKDLARTRPNLDLSTVCVSMLRPQLYTDLFREEARRYGIPVNITDRFQLSRSPVVTHLLGLVRLPLSRFAREDVLRVATSPYFSFGKGRVALDATNLAQVSSELRITGNLPQWELKIDRALQKEKSRASATANVADQNQREELIASLSAARRDIQAVASAVKSLEEACRAREFVAKLEGILELLNVRSNLVAATPFDEDDLTERNVRAYKGFQKALGEMAELLEFQHGRETRHNLRSYLQYLTTAVLRERYNVHEQFGTGVLVTSIDETRGLSMNVMIVAGLLDGEFPEVYQPEVFLSAERRRERETHATWQNRYLFYQAITNWADHLYLTFPRKEGELDLVRSSFLDALLNVAVVEEWNAGENIPFERALYSEDELLRWSIEHEDVLLPTFSRELEGKLDNVRHAVVVDRSRTSDHVLKEYDGILQGSLSLEARNRLREFMDRSFSITQLETYGQCPFRFFAGRILELNVASDLEEELTPLERGSILHEALFEFYIERRAARKLPLAGCSDATFEEALGELIRIVESKVSTLDIPDAFWDLDRELLIGGSSQRRGLVREFLEAERRRDVDSQPMYFEVAFGGSTGDIEKTDPQLSQQEPVVLGALRLRGKVDRVEIGDGYFSIVDYKTSQKLPTLDDIRRGMSLQLPLYLRALSPLLAKSIGKALAPAAGLYYRLRVPVRVVPGLGLSLYNKRAFTAAANSRNVLKSEEEFNRVLDGAVAAATSYVHGMVEGRFPLTGPENVETVCVFCDYHTACRIQSARHVPPKMSEGS